MTKIENRHHDTVEGFGDEWHRYDQSSLSQVELADLFERYFGIFPWTTLDPQAVGFDMGCGSGRWAKLVAPRVGKLYCVDPSSAIEVAKKNLAEFSNCEFVNAGVGDIVFPLKSMDFGYSLGVLHHVPDTRAGLMECIGYLKPGAPFLVYLYYRFDNRSALYRTIWRASELIRSVVSRLPHGARYLVSNLIALTVYYPIARFGWLLGKLKVPKNILAQLPLATYQDLSFYTMRTDALDRFGTQLEQRFTKDEIRTMLTDGGLENVQFSDQTPYWCAVGYKK